MVVMLSPRETGESENPIRSLERKANGLPRSVDQALSGWTMQEYKPAEAVAVDGKTIQNARVRR
ncbi:hypothetical protein [Saccharopolyspora hattusasensis]|uniref:hypothetical protein n=1 Tax=Saccharopolyspora hattusasensis TaxID=1128679 RepID=UPI003D9722BF